MSAIDKIKNKLQTSRGRMKKAAGRATGDEALEAEGTGDQVAGNLKQSGEHIKDAFKK